ncbi:MAG TPA: alpha/beta fold hydrolase [Thermoanaerobaculia bacterium]|nr:alpha/beta fold hydrolase [Thermoanaerobaculia bacterium]
MEITSIDFSPAWWLPGAHLQTVWGRLARSRRLITYRRESLATPDGDELLLDHFDVEGAPARHVVLLHGLEGSSYSVYIQGLVSLFARRGIPCTVLNFRFCARDPKRILRAIPNRRPRMYHSGETTDFDFVLKTLASRHLDRTFLAVGASLGGNVLLKWLGENSQSKIVRAAATLSVPYDLSAGARHLDSPTGRFYVRGFIKSLTRKLQHVVRQFPQTSAKVDLQRASQSRTFFDFDDAATAPLHGFAGADDYYARSSSIHFLPRITCPTLCLSALDDPFLPADVLEKVRGAVPQQVRLLTTRFGGHVGFIGGLAPWSAHFWGEKLIVDWILNVTG